MQTHLLYVQAMLLTAALQGCGRADGAGIDREAPAESGSSADDSGRAWFVESAREAGIDFTHVNGMSGRFDYPEIFAPGVALFDFDNDGDLDVYISQGGTLDADAGTATQPHAPDGSVSDRLYRNDLAIGRDGQRTLQFVDVTRRSGLSARGYGMGAAAGDVDNDGCVDLYLTRYGHGEMFRNNCDGTFTDVSSRTGTGDVGWAVSASFVDYDRDGWLDLYVGSYVHYDVRSHVDCFSMSGRRNYCAPDAYRAQPGHLYRNQGGGVFTDVTGTALVPRAFGPALGISSADFNGDGWPDIYVANDGAANQLWISQGGRGFRETALLSGTAVNGDGKPEASMGLDAGDFDADGDEDLLIANLTGEGMTLYQNDGRGLFDDVGSRSGLRGRSLRYTGFGAAWLDFDNDGWLDILTVNGAVRFRDGAETHSAEGLQQQKQLFRNLANGRFEDVTPLAGPAMRLTGIGRGAAFGDVDNDGDIDVLVGNNGGPAQLFINQIGNRRHWLGLKLVGDRVKRDMLGARVGLVREGRSTLWRRVRADGSYASANDPRVLFGLSDSTAVAKLQVVWPDGRTEDRAVPGIDRWLTLTEGGGR
jgi:hypothetical protein